MHNKYLTDGWMNKLIMYSSHSWNIIDAFLPQVRDGWSAKTKALYNLKNLFFKDLCYLHFINPWIYSLKYNLTHKCTGHSYWINFVPTLFKVFSDNNDSFIVFFFLTMTINSQETFWKSPCEKAPGSVRCALLSISISHKMC